MHWLILLLAGIFETLFAFCLGKAKWTTQRTILVVCGFCSLLNLEYGATDQSYQSTPHRDCLCCLDRHWGCGHCAFGDFGIQRTGHVLEVVFYVYLGLFDCRTQDCNSLIISFFYNTVSITKNTSCLFFERIFCIHLALYHS